MRAQLRKEKLKMKKITKIFITGLLTLIMIAGMSMPAMAATETELTDMVSEEMTANYLYTELAAKFPEVKVFANLAKSEMRHIAALKKAAARLGLSVEAAKPADILIPKTVEDALAFAMAYELEDIEMLKVLIEKEEDAMLKRVLNNLLKGSERHYNALKRVADNGVENCVCNEDGCTYQNKVNNRSKNGGQGNGQKANANAQKGMGNGQKGQGNRNNSGCTSDQCKRAQ